MRASPTIAAFLLSGAMTPCWALATRSARAATDAPSLSLVDCPPKFANALERHLDIELTSLQSELERPLPLSELAIRVRCGMSAIALEVDRGTAARATRRVDITGAPADTHSRLVALAAGELIYVMLSSSNAAASPVRVQPGPAKPVRRHASPRQTARRVHALATGGIHRIGRPAIWLGAPGVAIDAALTSSLGFQAAMLVGFGSSDLDRVRVRVLTLGASAYGLIGRNGPVWRWGVGPGARFGWARLAGESTGPTLRGETLTGVWGGPGMAARGLYAPSRLPLVLSFALEGTLVTLPLKGTLDRSSELFALDGAWAGATLGVGY